MSLSQGTRVLTRKQIERAVHLGRIVLGDVGDRAIERHEQGNGGGCHVIHVRRALTPDEELLTPDWFRCAVPIDRAGGTPLPFRVR